MYLNLTITITLYTIIIFSCLYLFSNEWLLVLKKLKSKRKLINRLKTKEETENLLEQHLRKLLSSAIGDKVSIQAYLAFTISIMCITILVSLNSINLLATLMLSTSVGFLPYLFLRLKVENMRYRSSHEADTLMTSIINQYRIQNFNMQEAIEQTIHQTPELKATKKLLYRLVVQMRNSRNDFMLLKALQTFAFSIDTNWSRMLANNIYMAHRGVNITLSLEDILKQIREAKVLKEDRIRLNGETFRMTTLLVPVLYLSTIFFALFFLDMTLNKVLQRQLYTAIGLMCFLVIIVLFFINVLLIEFVRNRKFDL